MIALMALSGNCNSERTNFRKKKNSQKKFIHKYINPQNFSYGVKNGMQRHRPRCFFRLRLFRTSLHVYR
ncbi:hypothetical protein T10_13354 [Trichinella papuae]|uniref:Uncharacterized protein n=1 Tax=Trichinella papuae TaxID=268474 RepID=A0A0V1MJ51_9BILA|nr:hypothetical protein T10_13354 [Trichinella papuae]